MEDCPINVFIFYLHLSSIHFKRYQGIKQNDTVISYNNGWDNGPISTQNTVVDHHKYDILCNPGGKRNTQYSSANILRFCSARPRVQFFGRFSAPQRCFSSKCTVFITIIIIIKI